LCPVLRAMRIDLHAAYGVDDRLFGTYTVFILMLGWSLAFVHRLAFLLCCKPQVRRSKGLCKP
jgi:hypothetical protein